MSVETINLTPTWESLVGQLLTIYEATSPKGKKEIIGEFKKMAIAADKYNELISVKEDKVIDQDCSRL